MRTLYGPAGLCSIHGPGCSPDTGLLGPHGVGVGGTGLPLQLPLRVAVIGNEVEAVGGPGL